MNIEVTPLNIIKVLNVTIVHIDNCLISQNTMIVRSLQSLDE